MKSRPYDITSQDYKRDPFPVLTHLLEAGPVVPIKFPLIGPIRLATSYDAVNELLREHHTFVRDPRTAGLGRGSQLPWWFPRWMRSATEGMILRDEPDHRRLRALVEQAFVRRSIERLRPIFVALADRMLDELEARYRRTGRPVDLVAGLARPFPLAVICEVLGLPHDDRPMFERRSEAFARDFSIITVFRMLLGLRHVDRYVREQIRRLKTAPREGLISDLIAAESDSQRLTDDEMAAMILLLLMAGHVTTVHLIGAGIHALCAHAKARDALLADWSLAGDAVNEILRYFSPVQMSKPLLASRDLTWQGATLRRGDKVAAFLASANVDPRRFDAPERFDICRAPNPHVAFGAGPHNCLGWKLATAETEIALERLFTRFPNLQPVLPASQIPWSRQPGTRGPAALEVRLT